MFKKLTSAVTSLTSSPSDKLPASHRGPARAAAYTSLAKDLSDAGVPVDTSDCVACDHPCPVKQNANGHAGEIVDGKVIWEGKDYEQYVMNKYGDLGQLPAGFDQDWETDLMGSGGPPRGRIAVISTGKSDWERDHYDEKAGLPHKLHTHLGKLNLPDIAPEADAAGVSKYVKPTTNVEGRSIGPPSMYSSSIISQSDDPEDQTVLVFPDWKVVHEVENSEEGAESLYDNVLDAKLGRAGRRLEGDVAEGVGRLRSWVLPYRAVVLLCSHKRRDKRCHIAAPLLRSALISCLAKHDITVDETGGSLINLDEKALETIDGTESERAAEAERQRKNIEGVEGGEGGEVGIFNINHLGGHRYAGVMLILFPSGAYLSYGRVSPQEIPRVVEETILKGKVVPGLLRSAAGVAREGGNSGNGFLGW